MAGPANLTQPQQRRFTRSSTISQIPSEALDGEFVPASLSHISDLLRVATDIEPINPRVAYLCRFHAFAKADRLDPSSKGRGVRQFKTALKLRLDKDDKVTATQRTEPSDAMELRKFYQAYHDHYIKALEEAGPKDRAQLAKIYQTAGILFEVLRAVDFEVEPELRAAGEDIKEKQNKFSTYNILPLDEGGADLAIMDLEEISATVGALRNTNALLWPSTSGQVKSSTPDLLDWLQAVFGFQNGNVANQKEHLILLLANMQACLDPTNHSKLELDNRAVGKLMDSLFANYNSWCNFLDRKSNIKTPVNLSNNQQDSQQYNLLYMGLYLLIWGESANVRFMPECLCYIFHMMASQLNIMLASTDVATLDKIVDGYGGENDSFTFLRRVVTPIYDVLQKEAANNKKGTAPHSAWRNYDDLNEFFWSKDCLKLQWPLEDNAEFFQTRSPLSSKSRQKRGEHGVQKVNFVEIRTFFHIFRSFDRMWSFYILALQTMVILSWSGTGSPVDLLHFSVLENLLSIFITAAVLRLGQALIEIALNYKSYHTPRHMVRPLLKLVVAVAWVIVLPICYVHSWENPNGILGALQHWLRPTGQAPSLYISAVAIYLLPNMISALLFLLPLVRRDLEKSKWKVFELLLWWLRPRLFVGRGMQEGPFSFLKYTLFWLVLLSAKLTFSYVIQINPLVKLTKAIIKVSNVRYEWHEFFPHDTNNLGAVISIWAPVLLVYFLDTQIWYSFMSALWGGFKGAYLRLGEIRTLGMLRSRFESLPKVFNDYLVSPDDGCSTISTEDGSSDHLSGKEIKKLKQAKFSQLWNEVIYSFRREDFISDKELDLLRIPFLSFSDPMLDMDLTRWPAFLLASKVPVAVNMAVEFDSKDQDPAKLWKRVGADKYRKAAVEECYKMFQLILDHLIVSTPERNIMGKLFNEVDESIRLKTFLIRFKMKKLPLLCEKFVDLITILQGIEDDSKHGKVVINLQDMLEVITKDMMEGYNVDDENPSSHHRKLEPNPDKKVQLFAGSGAVRHSLPSSPAWEEQMKRLYLLLTDKESAMDVPTNLVARRRINFFTNSLFMDMPKPPSVREMVSFSVLTPYYEEDTIYSKEHLDKENEDGISILFYLQKIYPDEWDNLLQRLGCKKEGDVWKHEQLWDDGENELELRYWASTRGQTLFRTVRGMMYYSKALKLQSYLDTAQENDIRRGYNMLHSFASNDAKGLMLHDAIPEAIVDMKFTYVVSCQKYGAQKHQGDQRATDIHNLMIKYPCLRVAYIDEKEVRDENHKIHKEYYSVLVKAVNGFDEEIYRIKLPGAIILGEGKPENQNHAIIFTRGEALQAIDMNQDNYLEEAFKMRNLLREFQIRKLQKPTILGLREHIFTGSVSSLAWFMSMQETSFVTLGQRVLTEPLRTRFHYGHPDVFDRIFHITRGGISKASKVINLSEDIFAGFNSTSRGGSITHHEYIQVGKGRDVGLNQISMFEAKVASGNGEQALSRDIYRLGQQFDFFRMLTCYFTTVGFYFSSMLVVLTVYAFLYGRLYLTLSGLEQSLVEEADLKKNVPLVATLASQSLVQLGILMALPMVVEIGLEFGFWKAVSDFVIMQLQLASIFFTFSLGTKTHYFGRTILHGGARYQATGRGFVVRHEKFAENYRLYSRSHFTKGLEIMALLIIYEKYGSTSRGLVPYILVMFPMWFLVTSWLFGPFLFNPSGFDWQKIVEDWVDWKRWIECEGGIGVPPNRSWESWWNEEQEHLKHTGLWGRIWETLLLSRFFLYQYGLVYHLDIVKGNKQIEVYGLSWLVIASLLVLVKVVSMGKQRFGAEFQLLFRLLKAVLFFLSIGVLLGLFFVSGFSSRDLLTCVLAFLPTGWALLQIAQAWRPAVHVSGFWDSVKALAQGYEYLMGLLLFAPVAVLAWFPFISEFQSRLLFNQAFSRGLQISRILAGGKKG